MFFEVACGLIQPLQVAVLMEFIPFYCDKLAVICVLPSNTTKFLNPTMHAKCFGLFRPSSGTEVQNLKPRGARVRSILQFLRSHEFYHCQNTGLFFDVLLTLHLSITLVNDQLDAQLFYFIILLLQSPTCFEQKSCSSSGGQIVLIQYLV